MGKKKNRVAALALATALIHLLAAIIELLSKLN